MKVLTYLEYFRRAHSTYFSFLLQILNFSNWFFLALVVIGILQANLQNYILLICVLAGLYVPLNILLGGWDFRKGAFIQLQKIVRKNSPLYGEIFSRLDRIEKLLLAKEKQIEV